jgi:cation diffusion facilitator CzcD-associated flavoprotein CzcO
MNILATTRAASAAQSIEHFDVLIVGAGISGVGSAYHLTTQLPGSSFAVAAPG